VADSPSPAHAHAHAYGDGTLWNNGSTMRAVAFTGTVTLVLPIWWLVSVAKGDPNEVLALCCAIFGLTFSTSVAVLARRS
jgi:hypothetical protein